LCGVCRPGSRAATRDVHGKRRDRAPGFRLVAVKWAQVCTALEPRIVVSGHKRAGAADDPKTIGESQQYLRDFSRVAAREETVEGIVSAMLELHPGRDNPRVVWHCAREAVKKRQGA